MPGSVQSAAPVAAMPSAPSRAFAHTQQYAVLEDGCRNSESQRSPLVATSRKCWRLGKRLTPALLQQLLDFYDARNGAQGSLFF